MKINTVRTVFLRLRSARGSVGSFVMGTLLLASSASLVLSMSAPEDHEFFEERFSVRAIEAFHESQLLAQAHMNFVPASLRADSLDMNQGLRDRARESIYLGFGDSCPTGEHSSASDYHVAESSIHDDDSSQHHSESDMHCGASETHDVESNSHSAESETHDSDSDAHNGDSDTHYSDSEDHFSNTTTHQTSSTNHDHASHTHNNNSVSHSVVSNHHYTGSSQHTGVSDYHVAGSDSHAPNSDVHLAASTNHSNWFSNLLSFSKHNPSGLKAVDGYMSAE